MRVLIADKLTHGALHAIERGGHEVEFAPSLTAETLPTALANNGAEVLVVRSTRVTEATLRASRELGLVIRAGAGVNTIDLAIASQLGVFVANCPGKNAVAVAELTIGLMICLDRGIPAASAKLHEGQWCKSEFSRARGLLGQRLGLVGFGATARAVAYRAQALGMHVAAWTPRLHRGHTEPVGVEAADSLDTLLSGSDVVSVHCPNRPETRGMIGARELDLIPDGGAVLHTARGGIVDDAALAEQVHAGRLRAGLDVFAQEPAAGDSVFESPMRNASHAVLTPHIGASTTQALESTGAEVARIIHDFATIGVVHNVVNVARAHAGRYRIIVRHEDRVGVLAGVLDALRRAHLNVKEMQNVIFDGGEDAVTAASATIVVEQRPTLQLLQELRALEAILAVDLRASGDDDA